MDTDVATRAELSRLRRGRVAGVSVALIAGCWLWWWVQSGVLGAETAQGDGHQVDGATEPAATTPPVVAKAQRQLEVLQWVPRS